MKNNEELKEVLKKSQTDLELLIELVDDFDKETERIFHEMDLISSSRQTYRHQPIYRIDYNADAYRKKNVLDQFILRVEHLGFIHRSEPAQNAYCVFIKQD